ncbi:hypothetical protein HNR46_001711 [Haloferula luteola]|uniref:alpha-L-fucosidase n=1 Tax=Haloferula luteola TaxID=595692 RepID=A0A840V7B4_9BACT|nr:alpha-L-fucosidase [Haloferula luteola]MBB5351474.1 hypothetical protein [Haloferula luteola]
MHLVPLATLLAIASLHAASFTHPGCLSTQTDLDRMAAKVATSEQPWKASWDQLVSNTDGFMDDPPGVQEILRVGGRGGENYIRLARDAAKAYQLALRYHGSGEGKFADKAIEILNAWASEHKEFLGDTNVSLRKGIYGYQLACAAELLRDYQRWDRHAFQGFQTYMKDMYLKGNQDFLTNRHGTVPTHYWANWGLANVASMMAIGVLCDDRTIFDEGLQTFQQGDGNEALQQLVSFLHPNGLGQWQESGRDQGHSLMGPQLAGVICEIAWNQGIDLYGAENNRILAGVEYVSKYNLGEDVPYTTYVYVHQHPGNEKRSVQAQISPDGRGASRPGWDLLYHHYVNRRGLSAPWTRRYAEKQRPEGGGFNYGSGSGGFDSLGFTTLTHSRDPIAQGAPPSALQALVQGRQITLSWSGSAYAKSYQGKRSTTRGGPYTPIATLEEPTQYYVDTGLTPGTTYHYIVTAHPGGDSEEITATADQQLDGAIIGTTGSYANSGADRTTAFDGSLQNDFDPPGPDAWVGLDLGDGSEAQITGVRFCPRNQASDRMIGGKFQGSNTPDFTSGVVDLFTIHSAPKEGALTFQAVHEPTRFRWVRYIATEGERWCNIAELQFLGQQFEPKSDTVETMTGAELASQQKSSIVFKSRDSLQDASLKLSPADLKPWRDAKFGMFIHWGLYAIPARGEWVMHHEAIPAEEYAKLAEEFVPKHFDANAWATAAIAGGMRYAVLTTRHHDGFALWDSDASEGGFCSTKTAAKRDFVAEYVTAFRKAGLAVGLYYSPMDWRFPGYFNPKELPENAARMKAQAYGQIRELMSHYGKIDILWYDGGWLAHQGTDADAAWLWEPIPLNAMVRKLQPTIAINPRSGWEGDFQCDEGGHTVTGPILDEPWEKCLNLNQTSWGFNTRQNLMAKSSILRMLIDVVGRGGNLLLNVGPDRNGVIPSTHVERLQEVGAWLEKNGEAIYGTNAGPIQPVDDRCVSTHSGSRVFLHLLDPKNPEALHIPLAGLSVASCKRLHGAPVAFTQTQGMLVLKRENLGELSDDPEVLELTVKP